MATQYTSYWLYQKYEKRGSQEAIPAYPNVWSVDGDGTMPKVVKTENDTACGYVPTGTTQYRWVNLPISQDFVCDECPAVEPMRRWEKSDQMICVEASAQYRWTNSGTTCVGYDKYQRAIKQVSYDSGVTWSNVSPAEYSATTLIEANSTDCGYVPPTPTGTKFYATYRDGRTYSAECDGDSELTSVETKPSNYTASAMTSAVVGNCVTSIGVYVFSGCTSLTSVTIPSGVTSIGAGAFYGCSSLTSVTIPSGVTSIDFYVFTSCSSLTSVTIPSGVTSIGAGAFRGCSSLTGITIPDSVTTIIGAAFSGCTSLTSVTIPSGVTSIGAGAFRGCSSLSSVTIPNSVTSIGDSAFDGCTSLTSVTIPDSVTSIGSYAFSGCTSLSSVTIPSSVTSIGDYAFVNCSGLTSVTIGSGVTSIGSYAFLHCTSLTSVTVNALTPPTLRNSVFDKTNDCPIYVPYDSVPLYKTANRWSIYASRIYPSS